MIKKIFRSIFAVSVLTLICSILLIVGVLNSIFIKRVERDLESEALLCAHALELGGEDIFSHFDTPNRITWIASDGTVLCDSESDPTKMSNHSDREEFVEAKASGKGRSERYSDTLAVRTVNYAILLEDGSVVRVSSEQHSIWSLLLSAGFPLLFVAAVIPILAGALAVKLSKNIVKPINEIKLEAPDVSLSYDELSPLLHKIKRQNELIQTQMSDLRESAQKFSAITKNMSEGIIIIDNNSKILSYNPASVRLLGANIARTGESVFTLNKTEGFVECVSKALGGKNGKSILSDSERTYQIFANSATVDGEVNGAVLLILDITERERGEIMRREFTSNVSHELKTPLTSIYGISEIMANGIVKPEDVPKFAKDINAESGRLITLVNDIIRLSQLDESTFSEQKEQVNLFGIAKEAAGHLSSAAAEKEVEISVAGEFAEVCGIYSVLYEMIYNLCDNAIKYNRKGGRVSISVYASPTPSVTVTDTGIGIPNEHLTRVFERFYRVDKSHSKSIGGTGLGLSIVKHAAAFHNAEVTIESKVDHGTKVSVRF